MNNKRRSSAPTIRHRRSGASIRVSSVLRLLLLLPTLLTLLVLFTSIQPALSFRFFNFGKNKQESVDNTITMPTENATSTPLTVLVVGATGATGKHVVQQLLDKGHTVKTIVRSQERMMDALKKKTNDDDDYTSNRLFIKQANSLLDLTDDELSEQVADVDAVVSCLGHTLDYAGMTNRYLVLNATQRLTTALQKEASNNNNNNNNTNTNNSNTTRKTRFILMSSEGVVNPAGTDGIRPLSVRILLTVIRYLVPPHRDNELAAQYVYDNFPPTAAAAAESSSSSSSSTLVEWVVVRPTDLVNENKDGSVNANKYILKSQPAIDEGLFGGGQRIATRSNVARYMVDLLTNQSLWNEWKFQMPCIRDDDTEHVTTEPRSSSTVPKNKKEPEF